jgi:hypothetical protein
LATEQDNEIEDELAQGKINKIKTRLSLFFLKKKNCI